MEIVKPQIGLFVWTVVIFLILFFILKQFAWKAILAAIDARNKEIESKLNAAKDAEARLQSLTADNERLLAEARSERDKILRETKQIAEKMLADAKAQAQATEAKMIQDAKNEIQQAKAAAAAEMKNYIAILSVEIAEKVLRRELENKAAQESYIRSAISEIKLN